MTSFTTSNPAIPRRIRLINWHGHENATLDINGGMLAIIGENGSGKSLILDAIDWALFPSPGKQFNSAAREGGRQSRRTLSNTILFFDPHGVDRPDKGWRRTRTVGYCAVEVEFENGSRWVFGAAAAATPHSASPWYYALPAALDAITFLGTAAEGGKAPLTFQEFKKANEHFVSTGGLLFGASQVEEYNRAVARHLLNIDGSDWQRRYDALYDVLHRVLGLRVDDALVADPSSVVRQFLPIIDRPHLERLVDGLEGIQRIHRDIEEYEKLHTALSAVEEARRKYHNTITQFGALAWLKSSWEAEDADRALEQAETLLSEARTASQKAEADEDAAYIEEINIRRELEALQEMHQGEIVQAVSRANNALQAAQREQERSAREVKQAEQRLNRAKQVVVSSQTSLEQEHQTTQKRVVELAGRVKSVFSFMPDPLENAFHQLAEQPEPELHSDALHSAAAAVDTELTKLEAQLKQLQTAREVTAKARLAERDAQAKHTAIESASHNSRKILWSRWERLRARWPTEAAAAPTGDPALAKVAPAQESAQRFATALREQIHQKNDEMAALRMRGDEIKNKLTETETELAKPTQEAQPQLTKNRERAYQHIALLDSQAAPLYWRIDFSGSEGAHGGAIEALLAHLDMLTPLRLEQVSQDMQTAIAAETDWKAVIDLPTAPLPSTAAEHTAAKALKTQDKAIRGLIDTLLGACALKDQPIPQGDYLCPDGRYRLNGLEGKAPLPTKTSTLIGLQRRKQAAAERRAELLAEREHYLTESAAAQNTIKQAKTDIGHFEEELRQIEECLHLLEEVKIRLTETQDSLAALDDAAMAVSDAQRTVQEAEAIEQNQMEIWKTSAGVYHQLADIQKLAQARLLVAQSVSDAINRAAEMRQRLASLQARLRSAEESYAAEEESYGIARAALSDADKAADDAQKLLMSARNALRDAGLENVEARITDLQKRLKTTQDRARQLGVAKGVALHQLEASQQRFENCAQSAQEQSAKLKDRNQHFGELLNAVARSLNLPETSISEPARFARQLTRGRESRSRLEEDLPRILAASEREQEYFLSAVGEYQSMVGVDEKFGLKQPARITLSMAPQGYLMDIVPRREAMADILLLIEFLQASVEQLKSTLTDKVTRVVRDIILGEVVSHLVEQLARAEDIIAGLNERLANARFFARNTKFSLKLSVRLARRPDIPFDHVSVATALIEHGRALPSQEREELTKIFSVWLDEQMRGQTQPSVETLVEQLDYRRWVDISLLHSDELDPRVRPWDSAVSGFGSGGEQRVPVYVLLITAAAMQFAVSNAPLRILMHDEAFARMDQRNADLVVRFAQQLGVGLVIASPNLDLFAEGIKYATAYRLRQLPNGLIAREALHLKSYDTDDVAPIPGASS